jgi:hypothetical protein
MVYLVLRLKDPHIGQLFAPMVPAIGIANPVDRVLQQVQNVDEPANTPYGKSQNSMNAVAKRRAARTTPKHGRDQKLIVSHER